MAFVLQVEDWLCPGSLHSFSMEVPRGLFVVQINPFGQCSRITQEAHIATHSMPPVSFQKRVFPTIETGIPADGSATATFYAPSFVAGLMAAVAGVLASNGSAIHTRYS